MKRGSIRRWTIAVAAALASLAAWPAAGWSAKPVRFVVTGPPGGSSDVLARIVGEALSAQIGQPVVVDNKPGGGGAIAVNALLAAPPDGQTLLVGAQNVLTEVPLVLKVGFDPLRDLKPVASIGRGGLVLVANPSVPAGSLKELVEYAKANRGKLSYASYSPGTASHYAGLMLNQKAGIDLQHVPYKGSPPALTDVVAGQLALMFDGMPTALPFVRAGKLKALAVTSRDRSPLLPQVPTFAELGYPGHRARQLDRRHRGGEAARRIDGEDPRRDRQGGRDAEGAPAPRGRRLRAVAARHARRARAFGPRRLRAQRRDREGVQHQIRVITP